MDEDLAALRRAVEADPGDAAGWQRLGQEHLRAGAAAAALEAARRALAAAPGLDAARAVARRAYVALTAELTPPGLREAIGAALGRAGPYVDPPGWDEALVLGGARDAASGTVAWVEDLQRQTPGSEHVDCQVTLRAARGGRELLAWPLAHYNPHSGTTLHHLYVTAEQVALTYHEKHLTLLAVVPLVGAPSVVAIDAPHLVLGDQVVFGGPDRGVLEVRGLPDLQARLPLPGPSDVDRFGERPLRLEGQVLAVLGPPATRGAPAPDARLPLPPGPPAPLLAQDEARDLALAGPLRDAPQPQADVLLGATAHPFWLDTRGRAAGYPDARLRWSSPAWLPVYWHRHLLESGQAQEAAALAGLLERLADQPPPGGHAPAERLARHLAWRAADLRDALRAGHRLPRGVRCHLWADWSVAAFARVLERFPPGFGRAFAALRAARPRPLGAYDAPRDDLPSSR